MNVFYLVGALCLCYCYCPFAFSQTAASDDVAIQNDASGTWGLQSADGEWVTAPIYDTLFLLSRAEFDPETFAVARHQTGYYLGRKKQTKQWQLFNKTGRLIYTADAILPRQMGDVVLVRKKNKWGLVAVNGQVLLPVQCSDIAWHEDVLALRDKKGKWRLFDPQHGRLDNQLKLDEVRLLSAPNQPVLLLVEHDGQQGILDQYFRTLVSRQYHKLTLDAQDSDYVYYEQETGNCGRIHLQTKKVEAGVCLE